MKGQNKSRKVMPKQGQDGSGQVRTGKDSSEQVRTGQYRTGQVRIMQLRTGQESKRDLPWAAHA